MQIICLDFESFFDSEFTLKRLSTENYIRDPHFEIHGCAIKWSANQPAQWYDRAQFETLIPQVPWSDIGVICHHSQFDLLILSHWYKQHPKFIFCTLSMARLLLGNHLSVGLDALAKHFNLEAKKVPYDLFRDKHWAELSPAVRQMVADGCCHDVELTWRLFQILMKDFPPEELSVVDQTVRMFTSPVLRADTGLLAGIWVEEETSKSTRVAQLGVTEAQLQSAEMFAALLRAEGVEPEQKNGKNSAIYAFAKTDDFMRDLLEDENPRVRALVEARLGVKSTLVQTRAETFGFAASRGALPVYLRYCGASTLRFSGGDGTNFQNMRRNNALRKTLMAPEGYLLAPVDASQIELRVLHWLAGGPDDPVLRMLRDGQDPYADLASKFYGEPIYKPDKNDPRRTEMEQKRGAGKQGRLMCLGPDTLVLTDSGIKPITTVELSDWLWDGEQWVQHEGVIQQGLKQVCCVAGMYLTPDHQMWCGADGWLEAICLQDEKVLSRALARGSENLPSLDTRSDLGEVYDILLFVVRAARRSIPYGRKICNAVVLPGATHAPRRQPGSGSKDTTGTKMCAPMNHIVAGCSDASVLFIPGANQETVHRMKTMADAEFKFAPSGKTVVENSWPISLRFLVGMIQIWKLIASTIKKATIPEIFDLQRSARVRRTSANSAISNKRLPTYDIACAGPRSRFTIVSNAGPLIVHNCGYGASGRAFKATAKAGLYGPPIDMSEADADRFVATYRADTPQVCARGSGYWAQAERMLARLAGGPPVDWGPLRVEDHRIYLPNGCPLIYDTLEYHRDEETGDGYWRVQTRSGWKRMWGAKLTQNICEGVSRAIVTQVMVRIARMGYRTLNVPHDELLLLIPRDGREQEHLERCMAEMRRTPEWLPGIPLDCEGHLGERYSK